MYGSQFTMNRSPAHAAAMVGSTPLICTVLNDTGTGSRRDVLELPSSSRPAGGTHSVELY